MQTEDAHLIDQVDELFLSPIELRELFEYNKISSQQSGIKIQIAKILTNKSFQPNTAASTIISVIFLGHNNNRN